MATHPSPTVDPSLTSLIGGIINDAKDLLLFEFNMAKLEMQHELRQAKAAAISFAIGAGTAVVGGLLLILMLVHLLNTFTTIPLWGCYGIIGAVLLFVGLIVLSTSKRTADSINVVPQQTIETLKEHAQWTKEQTTSNRT
jgi:Putative Actinobacterial Holin-X, holin superfamily III